MKRLFALLAIWPGLAFAQSADWQQVIWREPQVRYLLGDMTLGGNVAMYRDYATREKDPDSIEAMRLWDTGCRVVNTNLFEARGAGLERRLYFRHTDRLLDPFFIRLNSDVPYPETNVRYFMADIALGGSIEFYRAAAEGDHEMGCLEAVRRTEEGFTITNLSQFERKQVNGKTLITRRGSNDRISGMEVTLSSDPTP